MPLAVAMIALLGASCSNGSPEASSSTTGAVGVPDTIVDSAHAQALLFAACMRDNGVKDFPDPGASGALTIDAIANGSSVDTDSARFTQAISACEDLEPPGFTGDARTAEQQAAALEFAQCIRDNGVKDFPDPSTDSPLVDTRTIPSSDSEDGMAILNAAMDTCGGFAEQAGVEGP